MKRLTYIILFLTVAIWTNSVMGQGWSDEILSALPDESFAVTEINKEGIKIRHCPYLDAKGNQDEEQLIYVLGTIENETWFDIKNKEAARSLLETHYNRLIESLKKKGLQSPVNINTAKLTELVALPRIGPVLAVKIVQYRNEHGKFDSLEDIKQIKGIADGTFNAIRFYICTE